MSNPKPSLEQLEMHEDFVRRHIGPDEQSLQQMLAALNLSSLDDLVNKTVPASILSKRPLDLAPARGERAFAYRPGILRNSSTCGDSETCP